mmetsp:Transcript_4786/g.7390  ORF Transcript_4786/g.7390 Transcript_4786/m.7390 type:complete len:118 (+) Transcript_4786:867-1220(+)
MWEARLANELIVRFKQLKDKLMEMPSFIRSLPPKSSKQARLILSEPAKSTIFNSLTIHFLLIYCRNCNVNIQWEREDLEFIDVFEVMRCCLMSVSTLFKSLNVGIGIGVDKILDFSR